MWNRIAVLLIAPIPVLIVIVLGVVVWIGADGLRDIAPESLAALTAWSSFGTTLATTLIGYYAGVTAYLAISEFRLKNRPFLALRGAAFLEDGVQVDLGNASGGTAVGGEIRMWLTYVGDSHPEPAQWAEAVEALADEVERGLSPHFHGSITTFDPWERRAETLRWGPRASEYDPAWSGGFGVALWETSATDLLGAKHLLRGSGSGSGAIVVGDH
jgi:hypothetical protein